MRTRLVFPTILAALAVSLVGIATTAYADSWPTTPPLPSKHPVPGWTYELTYDVNTGRVLSVVAYDRSGPPFYGAIGRTARVAEPGQATMDISTHPELAGIMADVDAYYIDVARGDVNRKAGYSAPSDATPLGNSAFRPEYLPPLLLGLAAGTTFLTRRRWKQ